MLRSTIRTIMTRLSIRQDMVRPSLDSILGRRWTPILPRGTGHRGFSRLSVGGAGAWIWQGRPAVIGGSGAGGGEGVHPSRRGAGRPKSIGFSELVSSHHHRRIGSKVQRPGGPLTETARHSNSVVGLRLVARALRREPRQAHRPFDLQGGQGQPAQDAGMERDQAIESRLGDLEQVTDRLVGGDAGEGERGLPCVLQITTPGRPRQMESQPRLTGSTSALPIGPDHGPGTHLTSPLRWMPPEGNLVRVLDLYTESARNVSQSTP